jgi:TonB family protein
MHRRALGVLSVCVVAAAAAVVFVTRARQSQVSEQGATPDGVPEVSSPGRPVAIAGQQTEVAVAGAAEGCEDDARCRPLPRVLFPPDIDRRTFRPYMRVVITVSREGAVAEVTVLESTRNDDVDQQVLSTLKRWRFKKRDWGAEVKMNVSVRPDDNRRAPVDTGAKAGSPGE